jgi:23S rRNA (pseudouridine1915-N3)-methyltransferase
MTIKIIAIGRTDIAYLKSGIEDYLKRLSHYTNLDFIVLNPTKTSIKTPIEEIKRKEYELVIRHLEKEKTNNESSKIVLLDERGREFRSIEFADYIQKNLNQSVKNLCFIIGGAYGFDKKMYDMASEKLSLSSMTFSHQLIRILLLEQLYRSFTILKREPYHNE